MNREIGSDIYILWTPCVKLSRDVWEAHRAQHREKGLPSPVAPSVHQSRGGSGWAFLHWPVPLPGSFIPLAFHSWFIFQFIEQPAVSSKSDPALVVFTSSPGWWVSEQDYWAYGRRWTEGWPGEGLGLGVVLGVYRFDGSLGQLPELRYSLFFKVAA